LYIIFHDNYLENLAFCKGKDNDATKLGKRDARENGRAHVGETVGGPSDSVLLSGNRKGMYKMAAELYRNAQSLQILECSEIY
jgi:hypothetical protein